MADDTNFRSYRQGDPHARPGGAAPGRDAASDPLAELARLIGQTDPFADFGRAGTPGAPRMPQSSAMDVGAAGHRPDHAGAAYGQGPHARPPVPPHQFEPQAEPQQGFQPAYDPAIYGSAPQAGAPQGSGYDPRTYYQSPNQMAEGEEIYDDDFTEHRPRRGMKTIMVLAGLALLGTGAAFGYRAIFGNGGTASPPPVIKADTTPSKIAPVSSGEGSNKLIYDRVGEPPQGEKVVSREEKPVDVPSAARAAPRVVFPGLPATPERQDTAMASAPLGTMPPAPASSEPKKVRTITIRPDQPADGSAPRATAAPRNTTPPGNAPRSLAPTASEAPAPAASGNAPLSLSPQGQTAPPPAARPAPAAPTRIAAAASGVETGGYAVQISSQRSEAEAQASFRSLQAKYPNLLSDRQPIIRRADLGDKGIYFRAMVGPFPSQDQAVGFCGSLKAAGGQCVVQRN